MHWFDIRPYTPAFTDNAVSVYDVQHSYVA